MSKPHNCRHCSFMVCGDANWCSEHEEVMSDMQIWAARKCPEWEWNPIDALTLAEWGEHVPAPRRPVLDGQTVIELRGDAGMSEHIELTEPCWVLTVPGVREYVCRLEPVGDDAVNVTVCAPTEPIVRCRDCRYLDDREAERWDSTLAELYGEPPVYCESPQWDGPYLHRPVEPDGFCAWGERRDA